MANPNQHPSAGLVDATLQNLKNLVDVNTIIGDTIQLPDGTTIIPISKVSFGYGTGGSDIPSKNPGEHFGGGTGRRGHHRADRLPHHPERHGQAAPGRPGGQHRR